MNVKKVSTAQLKKVWNKYKNEERPAPVFAQQLKRTAAELKRRGEKLEENKMFKFDTYVRGIMESVKLVKESYEYEITYDEDFPYVYTKDVIPGDTTGDYFYLNGNLTVKYDIMPGQDGGWDDPSYDPQVEIEGMTWDSVKVLRTTESGEVAVTPESIGTDLYEKIFKIMKAQGEKRAYEEVKKVGLEASADFNEPYDDQSNLR